MIYRLIVVVSSDGFIAKYSGHLPYSWTSKEEKENFKKDLNCCEWSVMGRKTHELSYNNLRKRIIFTSSVEKYKYAGDNNILFNPSAISFAEVIDLIKPAKTICILGGTKIHDYFMDNDLLNEAIITIEPIKFGKGISLFTNFQWTDFPYFFLKKGFRLNRDCKKINKQGTRYYHFLRI
ncbi:MAG: Dihydrofolate reductase [Alphaproteobacteria bacterium MarineAlpha5_Bin11]|nr:hypothetical protein [Pelagibacteraceae bacterium]PPR43429.1 MAG: Dihydrofolate reductase [Alphaproteobacteria bacterium MarineAlpha5_Bin11]|tara:strand:- start:570 stop:1106 length:537 start_codon:yes stop_codon:yes gene_type:complete